MRTGHISKTNKEIGSRLTQARQKTGITQIQIAALLRIPQSSVSRMESGERELTAKELIKLSQTYQVDPEWLVPVKASKVK